MPTSWYQATTPIMQRIMMEAPQSILDIGVGFGKYGVMLREVLDIAYERYGKEEWTGRIDGIESFAPYNNPLHNYAYDTIYYEPVQECIDRLGMYDVILLIDVLEHFTKEEGEKLIEKLMEHTQKALLISTPIDPAPQADYKGNTAEAHLSRWTPVDFARYETDFTAFVIDENKALIVKLYPGWGKNIDSALRPADQELLRFIDQPHNDEKLRIAYALPHQERTGGLIMLIEQMRWLKSRGHLVDAYMIGVTNSAVPDWMPVDVDRDVVIHDGYEFHKHIEPCDMIVAGWYDQIPDLLATNIPVIYWEQGSEPMFGDYHGAWLTQGIRNWHRTLFSMPAVLASVSDFVAEMMESRYRRETPVIPNGVDTELFHPAAKSGGEPIILLVGNPILQFKGFTTALSVLKKMWNEGRKFKVRWICQTYPTTGDLPFPVEIMLHPPREEIAKLYSGADILLFLSLFEGFGMPPLEGMASGLAVVCTDCGGPTMYLENEYNSLVVQPENEAEIFTALSRLVDDEELRKKLSENARKTALDFTLDKSFLKLEEVLYAIKRRKES